MKKANKCLAEDYRKYFFKKPGILRRIKLLLTCDMTYLRWRYVKNMRRCDCREYNSNPINNIKKLFFQMRKNRLGVKLGFEIGSKNIGSGLCLYHNGPIVINGNSVIGRNCSLHGDNCVGNDGHSDSCPIIGDNVNIGVGAKIIGDIRIADNVIIGAGSVVVKSIDKEGAVVVGVPGEIIK